MNAIQTGNRMPKKSMKAGASPVNGAMRPAVGKSKSKAVRIPSLESPVLRVDTLKELRKAAQQTQDDLAIAMGVGQGTVSRIEKRRDMLVSTLQQYVEGMGGKLQLLVTFPDRAPLSIECLGKKPARLKDRKKKPAGINNQSGP